MLSREERNELISAACFMHVRREELARQFFNQERCKSFTNPHTHTPCSLQPTFHTHWFPNLLTTLNPHLILLPSSPFSPCIAFIPHLFILLHTLGAYLTPSPTASHFFPLHIPSPFHPPTFFPTSNLCIPPFPLPCLFTASLPTHHRQSDELDRAPVEWEVAVTLDKEKFPVRATWEEDGFTVEIEGGETVVLNTDWTVGEPMMLADIGGKEVTV